MKFTLSTACSKYSLLDVLSGKSSEVEGEVLARFSDSVEGKGFLVENVTVGVPDVDPKTQLTIDQTVHYLQLLVLLIVTT